MNEQPTTRNLDNDIPSKTCRLRHKEGIYYLVRMGPSNSRVANLEPSRGTGFKVKTSDVFDIVISEAEIQLYLWGISVQTLEPLDLLVAARNRFERSLPHGRPYSEPDCVLWVPGKLLLIIEAKLASSNTYVVPDETRKSPISLTHEEVLNRYNDLQIRTIDYPLATTSPVPQQLFRYWQLGSWMAMMSDTGAEFHLCNLTRKGWEIASQDDFRTLIREPFRNRFHAMSWEDIYVLIGFYRDSLARLHCYLENKSLNLRQAFQFGRVWNGV